MYIILEIIRRLYIIMFIFTIFCSIGKLELELTKALRLLILKKQSFLLRVRESIIFVRYLLAQENIILKNITINKIPLKYRNHILLRKLCLLAIGAIPQRLPNSRENQMHIFGKVPLAYVHSRTHTLPIILISKNHHEMVRPYTCAYRHTKQYYGVTHCSTEDADIIRITIMHFVDLMRARERAEISRRLEISEFLLSTF